MNRLHVWALALTMGTVGAGMAAAAAPATPSYINVEDAIKAIRSSWENPQGDDVRRSEGWSSFLGEVEQGLQNYVAARDRSGQQIALDRLSRLAESLNTSGWPPAQDLRNALMEWLQPRQNLAASAAQLDAAIRALPPAADPGAQENRDRWVRLVDDRLAKALSAYEGAQTVFDRVEAQENLRSELDLLSQLYQTAPWSPALGLYQSLAGLFDQPNVDVTADVNSVSPFLNQTVVEPDVIYRSGQVSYVTPGQKTGFGLLPSNQGIYFYNSQLAQAVTPIRGFHEQVAQDDRGKQAAQLYYFFATAYNYSEQTAFTLINPNGIFIQPTNTSNIDAQITASKQPGHGPHVKRSVAALIGLDEAAIIQQVYEGAIGQIRQQITEGTRLEAQEKAAKKQAELNAQASRFLVGNNTIAIPPVGLTEAALSSQPTHVAVGGTLKYLNAASQGGADFPQPALFQTPAPGISADVHLPSALSNMARGYWDSPQVQQVQNLMIELRPTDDPNAPISDKVQTTFNADFPTFVEAVQRVQAAKDPKLLAARVRRVERAPQFTTDRDGNLVVVIRDMVLEVPAPPEAARGGLAGPPALIYRLEIPEALVTLSIQVATTPGSPPRVTGKVVSFDPGPNAQRFRSDRRQRSGAATQYPDRLAGARCVAQPRREPAD